MLGFNNNVVSNISYSFNQWWGNLFNTKMTREKYIYATWHTQILFNKIFTDVFDKIVIDNKNKEDYTAVFFQSNIYNDKNRNGIIEILTKAFSQREKGGVVYLHSTKIVKEFSQTDIKGFNKAKTKEEKTALLRGHFKEKCSFVIYDFTKEILPLIVHSVFILLENAFNSANANLNISKTVAFKMKGMRDLVASNDSDIVQKQAKGITDAISTEGKNVLIDSEDKLERVEPSVDIIKSSTDIVAQEIAGLINAPVSYINGILTTGLTQTGDSDALAIERCLLFFYNRYFKAFVEELLGVKTTLKRIKDVSVDKFLDTLATIETLDNLTPLGKQKVAEIYLPDSMQENSEQYFNFSETPVVEETTDDEEDEEDDN